MTLYRILLRTIIAFAFLGTGQCVFGQPLFTKNYLPRVGTNYTKIFCQTNNVRPGLGGGSSVWDFSGLVPRQTNSVQPVEVVTASVTPLFSLFQQSNIAFKEDDTTTIYLNTTKGKINKTGEAIPGGIIEFTETYDVGPIPIKYSGLAKDSYTANLKFFNGTKGTRTGTVHYVNDGYGTINTPTILVDDNVIRLRIIDLYTDSIFTKPKTIVRSVRDTTYQWYASKYSMPLLEYKSGVVVQSEKPDRPYKSVWYLVDTNNRIGSGSSETKTSGQIVLTPNPVKDVLMVQIPAKLHTLPVIMEIRDMTGRVIVAQEQMNTSPQYSGTQTSQPKTTQQMVYYSIPALQLPNGMYILRIRLKDTLLQKQFTVFR